ncbi:magnesium transporter MgtE N-terminal domain-containing protein [Halofilum ochraceum]|uniref:magnesium transporter MgtE N-terminal domain-containing protein n=1 Tax=Halofilum ochraceum TaxID=1611323 RepID=UPI0008D94A5E|nr:CBS domain-containing protein [Halofilum ochraceum]
MTDPDALTLAYLDTRPVDAARVLEQLEPAAVGAFLTTVPVRLAAEPLAAMAPWRAGRALAAMEPARAAALIEAIPAQRCPYFLRAIAPEAREAILEQVPTRRARALRRQLRFAATLVGAHMHAETATARADSTVSEAIALVRATPGPVQVHVVDERERPVGVVPLAALLASAGERSIDALVDRDCPPLAADLPLTQVDPVEGWEGWPERPVVDSARRLVGCITLARILAARREPVAEISAGAGPGGVLVHAYAAAARGLGHTLAGLVAGRGGRHGPY